MRKFAIIYHRIQNIHSDAPGPGLAHSVILETSLGDIVIDLEVDKCPRSCTNFLKLCKMKYYNFRYCFSTVDVAGRFYSKGTGESAKTDCDVRPAQSLLQGTEELPHPSWGSDRYRHRRREHLGVGLFDAFFCKNALLISLGRPGSFTERSGSISPPRSIRSLNTMSRVASLSLRSRTLPVTH